MTPPSRLSLPAAWPATSRGFRPRALWRLGVLLVVSLAAVQCSEGGSTGPTGSGPLEPGTYFLFSKTVQAPADSYWAVRGITGQQHLFIMRSDGKGLHELPTGDVRHVWFASLAPDHSRVAITDTRGVYLLHLATEHVDTVLYEGPPGMIGRVEGLAWSPDSRLLAVSAVRRATYGLLILDADGQVQDSAEIHPGELPYSPFAWSPDGARVLYSTLSTLWTRRLDGSDERQITHRVEYSVDEWPRYSPDGNQIAFVRDRGTCSDVCTWALMLVDTSGLNLRIVVAVIPNYGYEYYSVAYPSWSPDGSMLAYYSAENADFQGIRLVHPDGARIGEIRMAVRPFFLEWR